MPTVTVYSRQGCHLCELLIEELLPLLGRRAELEVRDVDSRDDWRRAYGNDVPVVTFRDRELCRHRLDAAALCAALGES